jgi:hypothetical protein
MVNLLPRNYLLRSNSSNDSSFARFVNYCESEENGHSQVAVQLFWVESELLKTISRALLRTVQRSQGN